MATGCLDGTLNIYDENFKLKRQLEGPTEEITVRFINKNRMCLIDPVFFIINKRSKQIISIKNKPFYCFNTKKILILR